MGNAAGSQERAMARGGKAKAASWSARPEPLAGKRRPSWRRMVGRGLTLRRRTCAPSPPAKEVGDRAAYAQPAAHDEDRDQWTELKETPFAQLRARLVAGPPLSLEPVVPRHGGRRGSEHSMQSVQSEVSVLSAMSAGSAAEADLTPAWAELKSTPSPQMPCPLSPKAPPVPVKKAKSFHVSSTDYAASQRARRRKSLAMPPALVATTL